MADEKKEKGIKELRNLKKETIEKYIDEFDQDSKISEEALKEIFEKYKNTSEESEILIKVILLNKIYSAGLNDNLPLDETSTAKRNVDVYTMAKKIKGISDDLGKCFTDDTDPSVAVQKILDEFEEYNRPYSFATKYCNWHNPEKYPIVDRYSKGVLYYYFDKKYPQADFNDYGNFCKIFNEFKAQCKETFGIDSTKELDKFLWKFGKEYGLDIE